MVVPNQASPSQQTLGALIANVIRLLSLTLRIGWHDQSGTVDTTPPQPLIYCIWHNRLALAPAIHLRYVLKRQPTRKIAVLISASKDGALLANILKKFRMTAVRGSSSRRGPQALLELARSARRGCDLAVTPDGPRGPMYKIHDGIITLAQLTGHPIVPSSIKYHQKISLKSWDAFQIPLPFSRCDVFFGKPIRVPRNLKDSDRESIREQLESAMFEPIARD